MKGPYRLQTHKDTVEDDNEKDNAQEYFAVNDLFQTLDHNTSPLVLIPEDFITTIYK